MRCCDQESVDKSSAVTRVRPSERLVFCAGKGRLTLMTASLIMSVLENRQPMLYTIQESPHRHLSRVDGVQRVRNEPW
jgi:hypothetical protein